jgi:hypothetical protein
MLRKLLGFANPGIAFGFALASVFWVAVLGWQAAYAPSEVEKRQCEEAAHKSGFKSEECKTIWERTTTDPVAFFTFWLVVFTGGLGVSTVMLWRAGERQIELARETSASQSSETQASISEAVRAATAMEGVAQGIALSVQAAQESVATLKERTAMQMRAYVAVVVGVAIYQERDRNLKFEARPTIINTGHTPAHNLGFQATAGIMPVPFPDDFAFPIPEQRLGAAMLGPQQNFVMKVIAPDFVDEADVPAIKTGEGKSLCVWGLVTYTDAFGIARETRFSQVLSWLKDGSITGHYTQQHNNAT